MSTWNIRVLFNHGVWHHFGCVDKNLTVSSFARKEDCYMYTKAVNWCFSWKQLSSSRVPYALETDEISYGQRQNEAKFRATILCLRRPGKSLRILAMRINRDVFSVPPTQVVMEKIQERCLSYYKYNFLRLNCYEQQIREFTLTYSSK